jgi:SulP family sulfate permease
MKNNFDFKLLKGDLFGGITAGVVALPLALAFGVSSGLGAGAGLYGAIFVSFFAALFGGTNTQISGPTAPMTAVSMVIVAGIIASFEGEVDKAIPAILTVFLLSGLMQIGLGFIGLGKYIKYIPYPVVSGFMTAIGIIILITQIFPSIGYYPKEDNELIATFKPKAKQLILQNILYNEAGDDILTLEDFKETVNIASSISEAAVLYESQNLAEKYSSGVLGTIKTLKNGLNNIVWLELILSMGTILIIYGFKRITNKIPSTLVALIVITCIAVAFKLDYKAIEQIPSELPKPYLSIFSTFNFKTISPYIFTALTLSLLGAIDSLLTSIVADNMTKTKHNPNRELIGQGIGNSVAALFGGIPGAGATIRTVVNINSGGKTRISGMIAGLLLFVILIALGPIASKIPAAVLAGILVTVGIGVMDYKGLRAIPYMPKPEVAIMLLVLILSSIWNLVYAVGIGLIIASLMFMKKIGDLTEEFSEVKTLKKEKSWIDELNIPENLKDKIYIKHIKGPLFFGSTSQFKALSQQINDNAQTVIIRMGRMQYMDQSGLYAFEDVLSELISNGKTILLVNPLRQPRYLLERIDIIPNLIKQEHIFDDFKTCLSAISESRI